MTSSPQPAVNTISVFGKMRNTRAQSFSFESQKGTDNSRLTQSQVFSKQPRQVPTTIPEEEPAVFSVENELRTGSRGGSETNSVRASMRSSQSIESHGKRSNRSNGSRKSTSSRRKSKSAAPIHGGGVVNQGFQLELDTLASATETGDGPGVCSATNSNFDRSSSRNTSFSSQVRQEQYCCFSRWSRFEKRLAISIGVLATFILILCIVVGVLASNGKSEDKVKLFWTM